MNARGSTEVIVATIGLSIGALDQTLYTMIVTMAVVTTLIMPPMLRWALLRVPFGDDEKARLDREAFEEKGFVTNLERLLLTVDGSANGRLAAHLAGLISGTRGLPTTVLAWQAAAEAVVAPAPDEVVKASAETARSRETYVRPGKVDVTTRAVESSTVEEEVVVEKSKGYDILFVGLEGVGPDDRPKSSDVARAAETFEGPLAVAHARGLATEDGTRDALRILVPVNGSNASRRAAEVAFALARSSGGRVTALYVPAQRRSRSRQLARSFTRIIRSEEAILRDVAQLGHRAGAVVRTAVRSDLPPDLAIIAYANRGRHDLVVLGVNRQPGERLSFGLVADTVLERSQRSVLIVAT
jgi:nucleotide-binding universal stress UspA family protein